MISKGKSRFLKYEKPILASRLREVSSVVSKEQKGSQEEPPKIDLDDVDQALDSLFPVKSIEREEKLWFKRVSRDRVTPNDVLDFGDFVDSVLTEQGNDQTSMHVKMDIYRECMSELIRQETVECPQRGVMLMKTTNVLFGMLDATHHLYESAFSYGMLKVLQTDRENLSMHERLQRLREEQEEMKTKMKELEESLLSKKKQMEEEAKKQGEEFMVQEEILEESNQLLEEQLEVIVDPRTAKGTV